MGHFVPRVSKASTAAVLSGTGVSGSELGHHVPRPSALGGPTQYDAKKGAIIGGLAMGKRN